MQLPHFGHLTRTADSLKKTLMLGKIEDKRKKGRGGREPGLTMGLLGDERGREGCLIRRGWRV